MIPYYQDDYVTIYHGDCREILPQLPDNSVDLVLTDPPYHSEFIEAYDLLGQQSSRILFLTLFLVVALLLWRPR